MNSSHSMHRPHVCVKDSQPVPSQYVRYAIMNQLVRLLFNSNDFCSMTFDKYSLFLIAHSKSPIGKFHCEQRLGIPEALSLYAPHARVAVVVMMPATRGVYVPQVRVFWGGGYICKCMRHMQVVSAYVSVCVGLRFAQAVHVPTGLSGCVFELMFLRHSL